MFSDDFVGDCKPDTTAFVDFPGVSPPRRLENDFPLLRTANEALRILVD
jgi:hypothetical protein